MEQVLLTTEDNNIILKSADYNKEEELQEIIKNYPGLIDLSSIFESPLMIIGRESEHIDVLAITADAVPVIIECKRKDNPDMRYLIAQVFEYASKLNRKSFREFDMMVTNYLASDRCQEMTYKNRGFQEAFSDFRKHHLEEEADDDLDLAETVTECLENGEFFLLVVVDRISDTAYQTIQFLNRKLDRLRIEIIEVAKFHDGERKIFVPNHVNREKPQAAKPQPGKITFDEMIAACGSQEAEYVQKIRQLWTSQEEYTISMATKGFSARYKDIPILYVLPYGIRIAPRVKRYYAHLFEPMTDLLKKHFPGSSQTTVKYDTSDFSMTGMEFFIEEVKELWQKANFTQNLE